MLGLFDRRPEKDPRLRSPAKAYRRDTPAALSDAVESTASYLDALFLFRRSVPVLMRPVYGTGFTPAFTV